MIDLKLPTSCVGLNVTANSWVDLDGHAKFFGLTSNGVSLLSSGSTAVKLNLYGFLFLS